MDAAGIDLLEMGNGTQIKQKTAEFQLSAVLFSLLPLPKPILWLDAIQIIFNSMPNAGSCILR